MSVFSVSPAGALTPVTGSPFATGSDPASVAFSPGGGLLATANFRSATVSVFASMATPSVSSTVDDAATGSGWLGYETPGSKAFDTVSLGGLVAGLTPTGSVTYSLFDNGSCTAPAASTQTMSLNANGSVPASADTAALQAGSYSYQASYSGDSNYNMVTGSCEPFTVVANLADLKVSISGPSSAANGSSFSEVVTVADTGPAPTKDVITALLVPRGVSITSTGGGTLIGAALDWSEGSILPGAGDVYTVTFKVSSTARGSVAIPVGAASLLTPDPNYANNAAITTVALGQTHTAAVARAVRTTRDPFAIGKRLVRRLELLASMDLVAPLLPAAGASRRQASAPASQAGRSARVRAREPPAAAGDSLRPRVTVSQTTATVVEEPRVLLRGDAKVGGPCTKRSDTLATDDRQQRRARARRATGDALRGNERGDEGFSFTVG